MPELTTPARPYCLRWLLFLFVIWSAGQAQAQSFPLTDAVISEFMAENHGALTDEDGDTSDWIEIFNPGSEPVNLLNWSLTDDGQGQVTRALWRAIGQL